ncbi:MAG TPA: DHHA1 domain-containing protein [Gemmatimonadaceae bacterium]|nr:DHHA1 domain-containing protein [Gemmatimonadaceae bacterium]
MDLLSVPPERRAAIEQLDGHLRPGMTVAMTTHINADGDGCGSEAALAHLLLNREIRSYIVNPTPWPSLFDFLLGGPVVNRSAEGAAALRGADVLVVLDISDVKRLGVLTDAVRALDIPKLTIDHHVPSDEPPGPLVVSDTTACATGELVYDLARVLGMEIDAAAARGLYVALLTDTGSFRFSNTSPRCHAVAGSLLGRGVDPEEMYRRIYASAPLGRLKLVGEALETLESDEQAGVSWISVPAEALERHGVSGEDLEGIAEYARSVAGTRLAMFFRDLGHGKVKVSFRSTGDVDVNRFARQFGGGGHARAAGALIPGALADVRDRVVAAARDFVVRSRD